MSGGYLFTCPNCGATVISDRIENFCEHGMDKYLMHQGGRVIYTTLPSRNAAQSDSSKEKS